MISVAHDPIGNMTSMVQPGPVTTTYGYNYENRLSSVTNPSYTAAYTYAADGIRLRVQESNNPNPDRYFLYDGVRPTAEGSLSGDTFTASARYVWEGDSYYDPLVYLVYSNAHSYPMFDGLGSTRQLLDSSQTVTDTYSYEAFGNLMSSTGTTPNLARSRPPVDGRDRHGGAARPHLATYRYVGALGYYQTGNDLMHLGARYYMPEVGRFMSPDAIAKIRGYVSCNNNPVAYVDPTGAYGIGAIGSPVDALRRRAQAWIDRLRHAWSSDIVQCACFVAGWVDLAPLGGKVGAAVEAADCMCQIGTFMDQHSRLGKWQRILAGASTVLDCGAMLAGTDYGAIIDVFTYVAENRIYWGDWFWNPDQPGFCACKRLVGQVLKR
jgi:RHS repeat-associated protein